MSDENPAVVDPAPQEAPKPDSTGSQKETRCRRFRESTSEIPPTSYSSNTPKEELLLQHVQEFENQFVATYGPRFLFLAPPNECLKAKFLPTTLNPSLQPLAELYDFETCAEFVANFLNYEEMKVPDRYPRVMPSAQSVLDWQAGDSFDFCTLLVSLLIGGGYDAYCVSGFAPRFITSKQESKDECPLQAAVLNDRNEILRMTQSEIEIRAMAGVDEEHGGHAIPKKTPYNRSAFIVEREEA